MSDREEEPNSATENPPVNKNKRHRKDKPWDTDDIDHWKIEEFKPEDNPGPFTEESSFACLFPKYRESYLKEIWSHVTRELDKHGITCILDLIEGSMCVKTTRKTWDPYSILKARDMIKLLARSVPFQQAVKIMQDDMFCDIIKIGNTVRNQERFVKRRQRLIGPNGNTLKALELLTGCYVLVQGNTVAVMGSHKGIKQIRRIILDCMRNIHPIYHIKELMIKRELSKDPALANQSWDRFLPKFKKISSAPLAAKKVVKPVIESKEQQSQQQQQQKKKKKEYTPFPPPQQPRKIDLAIESGEYFLSKEQKQLREMENKRIKQEEMTVKRQHERMADFVAPAEKPFKKSDEKPKERSIEELRQKILAVQQTKNKKPGKHGKDSSDDYLLSTSSSKRHKSSK